MVQLVIIMQIIACCSNFDLLKFGLFTNIWLIMLYSTITNIVVVAYRVGTARYGRAVAMVFRRLQRPAVE